MPSWRLVTDDHKRPLAGRLLGANPVAPARPHLQTGHDGTPTIAPLLRRARRSLVWRTRWTDRRSWDLWPRRGREVDPRRCLMTDLGGTPEHVISTDCFYAVDAGPDSSLFDLHDWPTLVDLLTRFARPFRLHGSSIPFGPTTGRNPPATCRCREHWSSKVSACSVLKSPLSWTWRSGSM